MPYECIKTSKTYRAIRDQPVSVCKIAVHTLGRQVDDVSENHVVFYLQVRAGSARIDMTIGDGYFTGRLDLQGLQYTMSQDVIAYMDIATNGHTVRKFEESITNRAFERYRFVSVQGTPHGCRSWIEIVSDCFCTDNLLNLSAFNSDRAQFAAQRSALLGYRRDRQLPPLPAIMTPGVFRAPGAPRKGRWPVEDAVYRALKHCSQGSRQLLGDALVGRHEQAPQVVATIATLLAMGGDPKPHLRWLSTLAAKEKKQLLAIASDFSDQTPETLERLRSTVSADVAAVVLELQRLKSNQMSPENCFITALSAAIRMGGYDEDDDDDDSTSSEG